LRLPMRSVRSFTRSPFPLLGGAGNRFDCAWIDSEVN